ncbi:hypothetical protein GCM10009764_37100 [Nocardia ninae]|uniref:Uncharacterized protein n=2 Tax=Nocardia ninae TaxID=356145 RepID=A0A511MQ38_9NOCA|nr:hypothetical protein NN4_72380 [Nocardia ninae NBRC 108245]
MRMQEAVGVAENFQIYSPERRVQTRAGPLDGLTQPVHIGQKGNPFAPRQIGQSLRRWIVGEQYRVSRQELNVAYHGEPGGQPSQHSRVFTAQGAAYAVSAKVCTHRG